MVRTICTSFVNVEPGDIALKKRQKQAFKTQRKAISNITCSNFSFGQKRKVLKLKSGGFPIIPTLR